MQWKSGEAHVWDMGLASTGCCNRSAGLPSGATVNANATPFQLRAYPLLLFHQGAQGELDRLHSEHSVLVGRMRCIEGSEEACRWAGGARASGWSAWPCDAVLCMGSSVWPAAAT